MGCSDEMNGVLIQRQSRSAEAFVLKLIARTHTLGFHVFREANLSSSGNLALTPRNEWGDSRSWMKALIQKYYKAR